jgi:HlyD family secretion protein
MQVRIQMSRNLKIILVVVIGIVIIAGGLLLTKSEETPTAPTFSTDKVRKGNIIASVSATGTLSPVITVQVGSQVSGTIESLSADFNDRVNKGEVIAQIDPAILAAKVTEAEANLRSSIAERDKAAVELQEAKNTLDRISGLFKKKLASSSDLDDADFGHRAAEVDLRIKQAAVEQSRAALLREKVNLEHTTIYAPIDGVVISRDVDVGQTVAASLQAPTLFTIAQDLANMQIEADVDEAFIGQIEDQQPVDFTVFAYPNRKFRGKVAQVRLQPKVEAGVVKYNVIIRVDNSDLALKPGMTATVTIRVAEKNNVLKVPNAALRYVPDWPAERLKDVRDALKGDESVLWIRDGRDVAPITVTTGIIGERQTEVSGKDLRADMEIVVPAKRTDKQRKRRFGLSLF